MLGCSTRRYLARRFCTTKSLHALVLWCSALKFHTTLPWLCGWGAQSCCSQPEQARRSRSLTLDECCRCADLTCLLEAAAGMPTIFGHRRGQGGASHLAGIAHELLGQHVARLEGDVGAHRRQEARPVERHLHPFEGKAMRP